MQIAYQHATDSVPRPSAKNPGVPEQLDELVLWATERSPEDRPTDAREMLERLRDIEKQLGVFPQVVRSTPAGATVVVDDSLDSDEVTRVMPGTFTAPSVTTEVDNATRLRRRSHRNTLKGGWLLAVVLVLAAAAGGVGWWFGSGPGSLVSVPSVEGMSFDTASRALAENALVAKRSDVHSLEVPTGEVVGTDPDAGTLLDRDATVTVEISSGPATVDLPALQDRTRTDVETLLQENNITVAATKKYFTSFAADRIVRVYVTQAGSQDPVECTAGCSVLQGSTAELRVSVGALPDVVGKSGDEASDILQSAGMKVKEEREFSNTVADDLVIRVPERPGGGGSWQQGEEITIVVSDGPKPVEVPNVVGETVRTAVDRLQAAGFKVNPNIEDAEIPLGGRYWDVYRVRSMTPDGGTMQRPGITISLTPQFQPFG
jgi:serine/threonine-protein kinase